ncbi:MAG: hypothetical protein IPL35_05060 [Sphingobacteriales bacterium]|nr:hypothetical protein [Sphingobacteriales bacterium]
MGMMLYVSNTLKAQLQKNAVLLELTGMAALGVYNGNNYTTNEETNYKELYRKIQLQANVGYAINRHFYAGVQFHYQYDLEQATATQKAYYHRDTILYYSPYEEDTIIRITTPRNANVKHIKSSVSRPALYVYGGISRKVTSKISLHFRLAAGIMQEYVNLKKVDYSHNNSHFYTMGDPIIIDQPVISFDYSKEERFLYYSYTILSLSPQLLWQISHRWGLECNFGVIRFSNSPQITQFRTDIEPKYWNIGVFFLFNNGMQPKK